MEILIIIYVAIMVFEIASGWKVFEKAGKPGWAILIPFYNAYTMLKIAGKPGWWLILMFIPLVNLIIMIITMIAVAEKFGQSGAFAAGLIFLGFIFFPILAWGDAVYQGGASPEAVPVAVEE